MRLKHVKTFESYRATINEGNSITKTREDFKLTIKGTTLRLSVGETNIDIKLTPYKYIEYLNTKNKKRNNNIVSYKVSMSKIRNLLKNSEITANAIDAKGKSIELSNMDDVDMIITTEKGYSGVITGFANGMGKDGSQTVIYTTEDTNSVYGVFTGIPDDNSKGNKNEILAYKKIRFYKEKSVPEGIKITDGFEMDKWVLTNNAEEKINEIIKFKPKGVYVTVGASKDYEDGKGDEKIGKKIKDKEVGRHKWDQYLVKMRFLTIKKLLESNGIKVKNIGNNFNDNKIPQRIYGLMNDKDKKDPVNRVIKISTRK